MRWGTRHSLLQLTRGRRKFPTLPARLNFGERSLLCSSSVNLLSIHSPPSSLTAISRERSFECGKEQASCSYRTFRTSWVRERIAPALGSATTRHFPPTSEPFHAAQHHHTCACARRRALRNAVCCLYHAANLPPPIQRSALHVCVAASLHLPPAPGVALSAQLAASPACCLRLLRRRIPPPRPTHLLPRSRRNARVQEPTSAANSHQPQSISPSTFRASVGIHTGH
ncbi:hypothetical protein BU25DRAFT_157433 [Macroventuria anomochaeta]|uniref:Uncharacterized protein n=1 Tax=Macroventuria anomochaeta TaxID=301207 RepID=A0ACB6RU00_9PLEO|nr:uncharacterized protein BU25DRAFT_157433 [Macroventuria anomochaeta]KAF2624307.1 hypothetical protein BU25DRAFT_157433 [Macroventuria anomochaeta]